MTRFSRDVKRAYHVINTLLLDAHSRKRIKSAPDTTQLRGLGGEYARTTPQLDLLRHKVEGQAEGPRANSVYDGLLIHADSVLGVFDNCVLYRVE